MRLQVVKKAGARPYHRVGTGRAAMLEVAERLEALLDHRMRRLTPEFRDERDATGIVFGGRIVEASGPRSGGCVIHEERSAREGSGGEGGGQ